MTALTFEHTWPWVLGVSPHTELPKTQTSRLVKPGELGIEATNDSQKIYAVVWSKSGRVKWQTGCTRAVLPGRCKPAVARIRIEEIRHQDVRLFTRGDILREGFADRYHFLFVWTMMHDPAAHREYPVEGWQDDPGLLKWWDDSLWNNPAALYQAWVILFSLVV